MRSRSLVWLVVTISLAAVVTWGIAGETASGAERIARLSNQVACPVCENSVADSQSAYARNIRAYIAAQIDQGETDRQILDGLAGSFGEEILLDPPASGFGLWLWLAPGAVILLGVWAMSSLRRSRSEESS